MRLFHLLPIDKLIQFPFRGIVFESFIYQIILIWLSTILVGVFGEFQSVVFEREKFADFSNLSCIHAVARNDLLCQSKALIIK